MKPKTPEAYNPNDPFNSLRSNISFPLLSKAGKAMKINNPRFLPQPSQTPPKSVPIEIITFERVQQELKKISEDKLQSLKKPKKIQLSSCFKTVSRSSNISPNDFSPAPTHYNPHFEFIGGRIKGAIAYRRPYRGRIGKMGKDNRNLGGSKSAGLFKRLKKMKTALVRKGLSGTPMG